MILKSENQVCSFEYSQELEKLGVKQNSIFYWRKYSLCKNTDLYYIPNKETDLLILSGKLEYNYSAFTVTELGEMLSKARSGDIINAYLESVDQDTNIFRERAYIAEIITKVMISPNLGAIMLIYLLKNNLITL